MPPHAFATVAVECGTGCVTAPTLFEYAEHIFKDHPLRALYFFKPAAGAKAEPAINVSLMHGVRASLELAHTGAHARALAARTPEVAPHLGFADLGGHGYTSVHATGAG